MSGLFLRAVIFVVLTGASASIYALPYLTITPETVGGFTFVAANGNQ
jgi:hypothetical protein